MTTTAKRFEDYWSGGDPVTMNRFLMKSITPILTIVPTYILFVTLIGPAFMKNRKPFEMRRLMTAYNVGLVAFYAYFLIRGAFFIPELGFSFICGSLNSYENETPIIPDIFDLAYQWCVVRCIELLDTVFLVLSKKFNMITPLHVFHHSIVPVICWFGLRSESSGYLAVFMAINSLIHIVMYTYYAIAALGPKYQKYIWWKKYLTSLQILQFLFVALYMTVMFALGCTTSRSTFLFCTLSCVAFFVLFLNYYRKMYNTADKQTSLQKEGVHEKLATSLKNVVDEKNGVPQKNGICSSHTNGVPAAYKNALKKKE